MIGIWDLAFVFRRHHPGLGPTSKQKPTRPLQSPSCLGSTSKHKSRIFLSRDGEPYLVQHKVVIQASTESKESVLQLPVFPSILPWIDQGYTYSRTATETATTAREAQERNSWPAHQLLQCHHHATIMPARKIKPRGSQNHANIMPNPVQNKH